MGSECFVEYLPCSWGALAQGGQDCAGARLPVSVARRRPGGGPHGEREHGRARVLVAQRAQHVCGQAAAAALVGDQRLKALHAQGLVMTSASGPGWRPAPGAPTRAGSGGDQHRRPRSAASAWGPCTRRALAMTSAGGPAVSRAPGTPAATAAVREPLPPDRPLVPGASAPPAAAAVTKTGCRGRGRVRAPWRGWGRPWR